MLTGILIFTFWLCIVGAIYYDFVKMIKNERSSYE